MKRIVPVLLVMACHREVSIGTNARVAVAPQLLDVGVISLGEEGAGQVDLTLTLGTVEVLEVTVTPLVGDGFAWDGPLFTIDAERDNPLQIAFRPVEAGYAAARVEVTTDAPSPTVSFEVRGRAVAPDLFAVPGLLDFGVVRAGESGFGSVRLESGSGLPVTLTGAVPGDPSVRVVSAFPITVAPSGGVDLALAFDAADTVPWIGRLSLRSGTATLPDVVLLRANDCARGLPAVYDVDGDGVTSCGGDCNDLDATIHPSGVETANGADDDCDGTVDNRTGRSDDDGDGWCEGPVCVDGSRPGDCQDKDPSVSPGSFERTDNGIDDNCDRVIDPDGADRDHDGYSEAGGDCNDYTASVRPGTDETVNGTDDDCDGVIDNATGVFDDDGDGACEDPLTCLGGAVPGDCADRDPTRAPGLAEVADFVDNNCDGQIDEGTERGDDDHDGFTEVGGDCDDTNASLSPAGGCP